MPVTSETLILTDRLRARVARITDHRTRTLVAAFVAAWDEHEAQFEAAATAILAAASAGGRPSPWQIHRLEVVQRALTSAARAIDAITASAAPDVAADAARVISVTLDAQPRIIASQLPTPAAQRAAGIEITFDRVPDRAIEWMVERATQQITSTLLPLSAQADAAMRAELVRGVAAGASPRETGRRIVARVEGAFNGGTTRAVTIARTETLDAHRWAAQMGQAANREVLAGWQWVSQRSARTCPVCWARDDGTVHPIEEPGPYGHPRCRCHRSPVTKPWAELGFTGVDEPDGAAFPSGRAVFAGLPPAVQASILGPARHAALTDGRVTWDDLTRVAPNPGWRPSARLVPLRDLADN